MLLSLRQRAAWTVFACFIFVMGCQNQPEAATATPLPSETAVSQADSPEVATPTDEVMIEEVPTAIPPTATLLPTAIPAPSANIASGWRQYSNANYINALTLHDHSLWAGTGGGLVIWDFASGSYQKYTTADGLLDNEISDVIYCHLGQEYMIVASGQGLSLLDLATAEWQQWTSENTGMVNEAINSIACAPDTAVLFVGYDYAGVDRYDAAANSWTNYNQSSGDLPSNNVREILWTPNEGGELWVTSGEDLAILFGRSIQFPDERLPYEHIRGLSVDRSGQVWMATSDGLVRGNGNGFWQQYDRNNSVDFLIEDVRDTAVTDDGTLWIGSRDGEICLFDPTTASCQTYYYREPGMTNDVYALVADDTGNVFYGRRYGEGEGISMLQNGSWQQLVVDEPLASNELYDVVQDSEGFIWVATDNGAHRIDPRDDTAVFELFNERNSGLTHDHIDAIVPDANGGIWFGGWGIAYFDGSRWTPYMEDEGLLNNDVWAMAMTEDGRLWIATHDGLSIWDGTTFTNLIYEVDLPTSNIYKLLPQGNTMWVATGDNGLLRIEAGEVTVFNEENSALSTNFVTAVAPDIRPDSLLIGAGSELVSIDSNGRIALIPEVQGGIINDIHTTAAGEIWVATQDGGIFHFDGSVWSQLTTADGLTSNRISTLFADDLGTLWFGGGSNGRSGGGLSRWVP